MKKKFAFMMLDANCDPHSHFAEFEAGGSTTTIVTVRNMEEAVQRAVELYRNGYGVIELCGAFGQEGAKELIRATDGRVGIGYVVHLPEQDQLFASFFAKA